MPSSEGQLKSVFAVSNYRLSSLYLQFLLSIQDLVSHSALHTVSWHDDLRNKYIKLIYFLFRWTTMSWDRHWMSWSATQVFSSNIFCCFIRFLTMFFSFPAHFLNICKDCPACNIPGVANTTWWNRYQSLWLLSIISCTHLMHFTTIYQVFLNAITTEMATKLMSS